MNSVQVEHFENRVPEYERYGIVPAPYEGITSWQTVGTKAVRFETRLGVLIVRLLDDPDDDNVIEVSCEGLQQVQMEVFNDLLQIRPKQEG